jgi:hypothetical protein
VYSDDMEREATIPQDTNISPAVPAVTTKPSRAQTIMKWLLWVLGTALLALVLFVAYLFIIGSQPEVGAGGLGIVVAIFLLSPIIVVVAAVLLIIMPFYNKARKKTELQQGVEHKTPMAMIVVGIIIFWIFAIVGWWLLSWFLP